MTVIYLAEMHNISFNLLAHFDEEYTQIDNYVTCQLLQRYGAMSDLSDHYYLLYGHIMAGSNHLQILYCRGKKLESILLNYKLWINALSLSIWVLSLSNQCSFCDCCNCKIIQLFQRCRSPAGTNLGPSTSIGSFSNFLIFHSMLF